MKLSAAINIRKYGADTLIILLIGSITSMGLIMAGTMEPKWMIFIIAAAVCISVVFIIPEREKFFLYFFFFALAVGLDFYPIHITPLVFRPLSGLVINFYDLSIYKAENPKPPGFRTTEGG